MTYGVWLTNYVLGGLYLYYCEKNPEIYKFMSNIYIDAKKKAEK